MGDEYNNLLTRHNSLMQQRQYQDRLFWSRVQTLYAVQAAVLGGSFTLQTEWYGWAIALLGIFLTALIGLLCSYDWQDAKVNQIEFFRLCDYLNIHWGAKHVCIRKYLPGNSIFKWTIIGFLMLDTALGCLFFWHWSSFEMKVLFTIIVPIIVVLGSTLFYGFWEKDVEKPD
jgi:hypothetical protein